MTPLDRGTLTMVAGGILGVAFVDTLGSQHLRVALVIVALVVAGLAALGERSIAIMGTLATDGRVGRALFGVGALVFVANVVALSRANALRELVVYVVGALAVVVIGALYLVVGPATIYWYGFLVAYSVLTIALIADVIPLGNLSDFEMFQHDAVAALLRGENPFAMTFPDIYPPDSSVRFYAEGLSVDGVLQFGFPYFPLALLVIIPFEVVFDYRVAHTLALVGTAILMSRMATSRRSTVTAMVFLLISPSVVVARVGWNDPLLLLALTGLVFLASRRSSLTSVATGVMFAVKQYTVFLAVPSLLLFKRPWSLRVILRHFAIAGLVVILLALPFILWNPSAFWGSVVELQFIQPFRSDSIAIPAMFPEWWRSLPAVVSIGAPFFTVVVASALVAWRTPTGAQGVALASAFVLLVAFVTSKQAFVNYYIVAIGSLFAASAVAEAEDEVARDPSLSAGSV